jgi:hypothetical protein
MKWVKERDLLIAETMAFVQSLGGKKPELEAPAEARPALTPVGLTPANQVKEVESPFEIVPTTRPRPIPRSGDREEIRGRVAAFRAHQQLFHRERDAYFNSELARLRKSEPSLPKTPGR